MKNPSEIKLMRIKRGLGIMEASKLIGVVPSTLSQIENGIHKPRIETLKRMAVIYEVPVEELYKMING